MVWTSIFKYYAMYRVKILDPETRKNATVELLSLMVHELSQNLKMDLEGTGSDHVAQMILTQNRRYNAFVALFGEFLWPTVLCRDVILKAASKGELNPNSLFESALLTKNKKGGLEL